MAKRVDGWDIVTVLFHFAQKTLIGASAGLFFALILEGILALNPTQTNRAFVFLGILGAYLGLLFPRLISFFAPLVSNDRGSHVHD